MAEAGRRYGPVLGRPWLHKGTDYNGNAAITTDEGMYVCSVPHAVAHRIVEDHNSAIGRQRCKRCGSRLDPDGTCPLAWEEAQSTTPGSRPARRGRRGGVSDKRTGHANAD